eukprot:TRINITY_DN8406_c0_g1_i2.p1 TRINITY_DN8406_c0_g1~~TRINITY_DN8406_c0_g1_i2.p1  ORF type:complete len:142 (+),score=20.15 TRINITY_DN8406_c0_g1_i2:125-550(+)
MNSVAECSLSSMKLELQRYRALRKGLPDKRDNPSRQKLKIGSCDYPHQQQQLMGIEISKLLGMLSPKSVSTYGFNASTNEERSTILSDRVQLFLQSARLSDISSREQQGIEASRSREISSCLLYTSPSPRDRQKSRMPSSA